MALTVEQKKSLAIAAARKRQAESSNQQSGPAVTEQVTLEDIDQAFRQIPGVNALAELAAGANRSLASVADFLGPNNINAILQLAGSSKRIPTFSEQVPQKESFQEGLGGRIAGSAGEILPAALGFGTGARALASRLPMQSAAQTTGQGVIRQLGQTAPRQEAIGAALAGLGQEVGREVGGETGAMVGGVLAPIAGPLSADIVRRAFSGGDAGRRTLAQALDDFAEIGETPSVGIGTGSRLREGLENLAGRVLGGSSIKRSFERTEAAMQRRLGQIADDLSKVKGDYEAGLVVKRGIQDEGGFVDRFINQSSVLWKGFDDLIDDQASIAATNTAKALDDMVNTTEFGKFLNNPIVSGIKSTLDDAGGAIDYKTFRALRSAVGERLGSKDLISDVPRTQLKRLYGALSEDLKGLAAQSGDDAVKALSRANKYTAAGHKRIDDFVDRLTNKVELDKVFSALTRGGEGIQSINAVKRSLKPEEWEAVASNVIRKMGRATAGQQDVTEELFSVNKFLTDWNTLGRSKEALFSGSKKLDEYRANLNRIASVAGRYKAAAKEFANPSGTAQAAANYALIGGAGGALASGNIPAFGLILTGVAANSAASRLMTSPAFVRWLARAANAPNLAGPIASLSTVAKNTGEYEAISELINTLKEAQQPQETQRR